MSVDTFPVDPGSVDPGSCRRTRRLHGQDRLRALRCGDPLLFHPLLFVRHNPPRNAPSPGVRHAFFGSPCRSGSDRFRAAKSAPKQAMAPADGRLLPLGAGPKLGAYDVRCRPQLRGLA